MKWFADSKMHCSVILRKQTFTAYTPKDVMCLSKSVHQTGNFPYKALPASLLTDIEQEPAFVTIQGKSPHIDQHPLIISPLKAPLGFPQLDNKPRFLFLTVILKSRSHDRTLLMCLSCRRGFISWFHLTLTHGCPSRPWQTWRDLLTCFRLNLLEYFLWVA